MNLSGKATLNPNAAEFVPFALRPPSATVSDTSSVFGTSAGAAPGKATLHHSESSVSNNSDDEVHQYWRHQLPDDITPDFKVEDTQDINELPSFSTLSLNDISEGSRFTSMLKEQQGFSPRPVNGNSYSEKLRYPITSYGEYPSPKSFQPSWEKGMAGNDHILDRELGYAYNGNPRNGLLCDVPDEQLLGDNGDASSLEFLASQFPGFAAENLAELYFANGCDLNRTIEMLTQLEVDGGLNHTLNPKASSMPNLSALVLPALPVNDGQNGLPKFIADAHQNVTSYRSRVKDGPLLFRSNSSIPSRGGSDFASAIRKMASQDSSMWKYERNGSSETSIGSSRSSHVLASSLNSSPGRAIFGNKLQTRGSAHASLPWLETGEAVANIYSETQEEARDHARLRNVYFEQARQAYIIGNKALAKELSAKGHLHNMYMKVAHGKAQESIYRQRNPEMQANGRERIIDLQGLHVNEAIHVLKRELVVLRNAARSADQRLLAYICVGTGHHARGLRSAVRLPIAVQRYLLEEEGLEYTEPQPGLLRVVIY